MLQRSEFQNRVLGGLEACFLHCCIGRTEKFVELVEEHIQFQQTTVTERTDGHMIVQLDYGSFNLSYKFHLIDASCSEITYNKRITKIESI